jgi:hypothetical protein
VLGQTPKRIDGLEMAFNALTEHGVNGSRLPDPLAGNCGAEGG